MMDHNTFRDRAGLRQKVLRFLRAEAGAITVDWVVLTGMIVMLGIAAGFAVTANVPGLADEVSEYMSAQTIREE